MSIKIMGQVWDLDLPANKLLVLLAMTDHADHNGENIYPSMELVAWKTGYSERQVRRIVKSLVKDQILTSQLRPGKTTLFTVHLENGKQKEPFKRLSTVGQNVTPDIAVSDQVGHTDVRTTPDIAVSDEPSLEPSINHLPAPKARQRKPDAMFDAIAKVWGVTAGGWIGNMKGMFTGTAQKGEWGRCKFDPPVTDAQEILDFEAYMLKRMRDKKVSDKPTACVTIQRWFYDFRAEAAKKITRLDATPVDLSKWENPDPFSFLESELA